VSGFVPGASPDPPAIEVYDVSDPWAVVQLEDFARDDAQGAYTLRFWDAAGPQSAYWALTGDKRLSPLSVVQDNNSNLRSAANGADYIAIAPRALFAGAQALVDYRAAAGLRTMLVDLQDVYDEFSYGVPTPYAVRDFLSYAYRNWAGAPPSYVVLVGNGHFDYKDKLGTGAPNHVPPRLAFIEAWNTEEAIDDWYACVSGTDDMPDMMLGRLPVNSAAELDVVVSKIIAYESGTPSGWNETVLFVADNPDSHAFHYHSDQSLAEVPPGYTKKTLYMGHPDQTATCPWQDPALTCRANLVAALN
jgi:hypothetical protein